MIVTDDQKEVCNGYLHSEKDYAWLSDTVVYFDNLRVYTFVTEHVIYCLREVGWQVHKWDLAQTPDPLTLDLTAIPKNKKSQN